MHKKIHALFIVITLFYSVGFGQQLEQYVFYQSNWQLYNPAALNYISFYEKGQAGAVSASIRKQWISFPDSPVSVNLKYEYIPNVQGVYGPTDGENMKFGAYLHRDQTGAISTTSLLGNYAYYINYQAGISLGFGLNAGVFNYRVKSNKIIFEPTPGEDPLATDFNQWQADFALGAFLLKPNQFYVGLSIPQTFDLVLSGKNEETNVFDSRQKQHVYLVNGYLIRPGGRNGDLLLEPSILLRYVPGVNYQTVVNNFPLSIDLNFRAKYDKFWLGAGAGTFKMAHLDMGLLLSRQNYITGNYDSTIGVGVAYSFPFGWGGLNLGHTIEMTFSYSWGS